MKKLLMIPSIDFVDTIKKRQLEVTTLEINLYDY